MITVSASEEDVRTLRLRRKLGQKQLSKLANVRQEELSKCERGLLVPDDRFFIAVAKVLGVSAQTLKDVHIRFLTRSTPGEGYRTAMPHGTYTLERRTPLDVGRLSVVDLFCGTGGFSHGFEQTKCFQVTAGLDLLSDRIQTFHANHRWATALCGKIEDIAIERLAQVCERPTVIVGGPPCQGFSSLRPFRTLTERDPRNQLIEHFALTVNALRPTWFVVENVVGLLTHRNGQTIRGIVDLFKSIGYTIDWRVLNCALYGLPQRRERLIIVGNEKGKGFVWPESTHYFNGRSMAGKKYGQSIGQLPLFSGNLPPAITVMEAIHDLPELKAGETATEYRTDVEATDYEKAMRGSQEYLTLHEATAHSERMLNIIRRAGHNRSALPEGLTSSGFSSSYSRLEPDLPSVTLTVNFVHPASNKCIHPFQDRALTPREGARLQGFEDSYVFIGNRAQIVKQIGNAVPPILGTVIARALLAQF